MIIAAKGKFIKYLSPSYSGKHHDYGLFKKLFDPKIDWFDKQHILVDLGFIGFAKDYKTKKLSLPNKRHKNTELTENQKNDNKNRASNRIFVEHAIGGMKRYRVLFNQLRTHTIDLYDLMLGVCAGLWNFYLSNPLLD
ncbi:transposase family protein [Candidatus Albibeggiatoa sp. nov. NOAA]|uniref:transposase family protein n=1 Tax=Candidatus Albibeggiatoa sp. nov. NOAA TaxID=3162724 RepID=UPI0032F361C6|nr:transposase family protein [Thiotrichaceae bacterium]